MLLSGQYCATAQLPAIETSYVFQVKGMIFPFTKGVAIDYEEYARVREYISVSDSIISIQEERISFIQEEKKILLIANDSLSVSNVRCSNLITEKDEMLGTMLKKIEQDKKTNNRIFGAGLATIVCLILLL